MPRYSVLISVGLILAFAVLVAGQSNAVSRCFQFTWLGPRFNNESVYQNATCMDATNLASGVPCVLPLVVSEDGTWPNVEYIWRNYPNVSCILAENDVCAKYTYSFNGKVENSTYFCTRAVDQLGNAITSGCHVQTNGSTTIRACFCRTIPGGVPCNNSIMPTINYVAVILITVALTLQIPFVDKT